MQLGTRPCWNDVPHDDVFLETTKGVDFTECGRISQHTGGILERGRTQEALCLKRCLGDTQQHGLTLGRLATHFLDLLVLRLEGKFLHLFPP